MREAPDSTGTWLCPTPFDRTRLLEMEARLKPARIVMYVSVGIALLISTPWMGWAPIFPMAWLVVASAILGRMVPGSERPEHLVALICVLAQVAIGISVALTGGAHSPALLLLILMIVTLPARFGSRGVWAGVGMTGVIGLAATLAADPPAFAAGPHYFIVFIAALVGVAACADTLMRAEVQHRSDSVLDPLTGLLNRKALAGHFDEIRRQAHYTGKTVSLVVCDLDHFKAVNDEHGHQRGDHVLRDVAEAMRAHLRTFELVYRVGGEEFLLVLPGITPTDALMVAERMRSGIESARPGGIDLTTSVGVGLASGKAVEFDTLYAAADKALYEAKRDGRNRVVVAPMIEGEITALGAAARVAEGPSRVPSVPLHGPASAPLI